MKFVSNTHMDPAQLVEQRLTELEIKASFSEDLLDELNRVIVQQQGQIDGLVFQLQRLRDQIPDAGVQGARRLSDDLPPHY